MTAPDSIESMARELAEAADYRAESLIRDADRTARAAFDIECWLREACGRVLGRELREPTFETLHDGRVLVITGWDSRWTWPVHWPHVRLRALIDRERAARGKGAGR